MSMTIKQMLMFFIFLLSWILLLILGESYFSYVLLGGISLLFLLFSNELEWQKINNNKWLAVLWILFLLGIGLSLFFSTNIPLSLYSSTKYIFSFLTFWFFLLIKKSFISSHQLINLLLIICLVILLTSLPLHFLPEIANLLPGMNLLYAKNGHNHLAALLLLISPLSWWLANENIKKTKNYWWLLLPVGFTLGLLVSFGRVAVLIGLVQLLFIFKQLKKGVLFDSFRSSIIFKILISLFSIVLLGNIFFSTATMVSPGFSCPIPSLEKQLCKSVEVEFRPKYWRWAIEIVRDNLWLGSGPGTFGIAAKKHRLAFFNSTSYAHNAFLGSFAEMGLIGGGLFTSLMIGLLYLAKKSLPKKNSWDWRNAAFLGAISIYLDVLFDFDWSFIGIFSITLMLLALLIRDRYGKSKKTYFSSFFRVGYVAFALVVIFLSGLYLKTDSMISAARIKQAFQFFPHFHWHRKIFESAVSLDNEDKEVLFDIYVHHPDIYSVWLSQTEDERRRQQIKEQWFGVDPWSAASRDLISYHLDQQDWVAAKKWLDYVSRLYSYPIGHGDEFDYQQVELKLVDQKIRLAEDYFNSGDFNSAFNLLIKISEGDLIWEQRERFAELLIKVGNELSETDIEKTVAAYELSKISLPWILSVRNLWFEQRDLGDLRPEEIIKYLQLTASWRGEEIGWKEDRQELLQRQAAERFLAAGNWKSLVGVLKAAEWIQRDGGRWRISFVRKLTQTADSFASEGNYGLAMTVIEAARELFPEDYQLMVQPANLAVLQGDFDSAKQLYGQCLNTYESVRGFRHDDCYFGLEMLEDRHLNLDLYWKVSKKYSW